MSSQKEELFRNLISEVRSSQNATDRFDQAVADALGLNRTDTRCLDVLEREGSVTAGRLAAAAGLTTGAMTTALDRLEKAGYARRVRDAVDRRRVLVELTPQALRDASGFYSEHAALAERLYQRHTTAQIKLLLEFVREGRVFNEMQAEKLERQNLQRKSTAQDHKDGSSAPRGKGRQAPG